MPAAQHLFEPPPKMSERQFQTVIQKSLTKEGWRYNHVYRAKMHDGTWRTTTTAVGLPDLMAFRRGFILAIECKAVHGKPTPQQLEWLAEIAQVPTGRAWVVDPRDSWQALANWIHKPAEAPRFYGWVPPSALALTA
jgi:hypothetical protein